MRSIALACMIHFTYTPVASKYRVGQKAGTFLTVVNCLYSDELDIMLNVSFWSKSSLQKVGHGP